MSEELEEINKTAEELVTEIYTQVESIRNEMDKFILCLEIDAMIKLLQDGLQRTKDLRKADIFGICTDIFKDTIRVRQFTIEQLKAAKEYIFQYPIK